MRARRVATILIAMAVLAAGAVYAYKRQQAAAAAAAKAEADKKAAQATAESQEIVLPATLEANTVATIAVPVPIEGKIENFHVEIGAEVYEGQLLANIRSHSIEAEREEAEIDLEKYETRVKNLESSMAAARLEASRAIADASRIRNDFEKAEKNYQRFKILLERGATPKNTFLKAEKDYLALQAEAKNIDAVAANAEERVTTLQRELDNARKLLEAKSSDLEEAKQKIGSGDVTSPVNGVVVARRGQAGENVHPSMADLFRIATDLSTMRAIVEVLPGAAARIHPGQPATVSIAEMGDTVQGQVLTVEGGKVTIEFANPNPLVKPGLTAQVRIKLT
jgi:membrane fusion protein (multidrug efflux system)